MISAFFNIRKIPELRNRVLFTLVMVVLYRIGCSITCPGVNASVLEHYFTERVTDTSGGGKPGSAKAPTGIATNASSPSGS